jgi:hypothetical protein
MFSIHDGASCFLTSSSGGKSEWVRDTVANIWRANTERGDTTVTSKSVTAPP